MSATKILWGQIVVVCSVVLYCAFGASTYAGGVLAANEQASGGPLPDPRDRTPTILVVDDEVLIRLAISDYLKDMWLQGLGSEQRRRSDQGSRKSPFAIDLVFSDVMMPGKLDRFGLTHWVRFNRPHPPIILTFGDSNKADTAKELCANEPFLAKPYNVEHVVAQIRALVTTTKNSD